MNDTHHRVAEILGCHLPRLAHTPIGVIRAAKGRAPTIDPTGKNDVEVALEILGVKLPEGRAVIGNLRIGHNEGCALAYERGALRHVVDDVRRDRRIRYLASRANAREIQAVGGEVMIVRTLDDVLDLCEPDAPFCPEPTLPVLDDENPSLDDLGPSFRPAVDAIRVALDAGVRRVLIVGKPGSGRTMLARRIASLLPVPELETYVDLLVARSDAGLSEHVYRRELRPFRAPHHTVSTKALAEEIRLALGGVLFLDMLEEFRRSQFEIIRGADERTTIVASIDPEHADLAAHLFGPPVVDLTGRTIPSHVRVDLG